MKILFFIVALVILTGCARQTVADKIAVDRSQSKTDNSNNANSNNWKRVQSKVEKTDQNKRRELDARNENFRRAADEFKTVDFKNFKYPSARLKNGEWTDNDEKHLGGATYSFDDAFFVDLDGDDKKEAIVMLYAVGCGGSCDGGRSIIHFYFSANNKPKLFDSIEMGSRSSGCSLKSFAVRNKKIFVEQFGKCAKGAKYEANRVYSCKFCVRDLTHSVYSIKNHKLVRELVEEIEASETDVMNYFAEISINE